MNIKLATTYVLARRQQYKYVNIQRNPSPKFSTRALCVKTQK